MKYIIKEILIEDSISDGKVLLAKVTNADDLRPESDLSIFAFPYSDDLEQSLTQLICSSNSNLSFWEPNEDDFVEDTIIDEYGDEIMVFKSLDLIPEFELDDDYDDEYDEEDLEREEDMFALEDETETFDSGIEVYEDKSIDEDPDDIFNDFYNEDSYISDKRYSEDELKKMSVRERHAECSKCSKAKNLDGLIDFYTYFFYNGCQATNEYVVPGLAYLYGRAKDVDKLNQILTKYAFCLWELSQRSKEVTQSLLEIGLSYPYISNQQVDYLESLYNDPKYCEMMDDILYDKEKLPRKISGITKDELSKTNDTFSPRLLKEVYNCFILNQRAQNKRDDEYTEYFVYVRRTNSIIKKEYGQVGSGECVIGGTLDMKSFIEFIEPKYGKECSNYFLREVLKNKPWYNDTDSLIRSYFEWVDWDLLTDIAKEFFAHDTQKIDELKMDIALLYLKRLNKKE